MYKTGLAVCCLAMAGMPAMAQLLVNEFSQGASGSKEYIEFAVQGQRTCIDSCADIRGWLFDDNNGWYGSGASSQGYYRFKHHSNWSCVPFGAIIVVYNPNDVNVNLPANDPTDADGDHVYVLPINSNLLEFNSGAVYSNSGFVPATDWSGIVLNNTNDVVQTINPAVLTIAHHAVSYGSLVAPVHLTSGGAQTVYYLNGSQYNLSAGWSKGNISVYETPGDPNTTANATWLTGMNMLQGPGPVTVHQQVTICATQLPYAWNSLSVGTGGDSCATYATVSAFTGCDSTTVLDLEVLPAAIAVVIDTAGCGEVPFEGSYYQTGKHLKDTLFNYLGCDSLYRDIYITVHAHHPEFKIVDTFGCHSVLFEGVAYYKDTTLAQHWLSAYGCDSLNRRVRIHVENFDLSLSMSPEDPYKEELLHFTTQANEEYKVLSWQPSAWFKEQQVQQQYLIAREPGTVIVYGQSSGGCTDTGHITFEVLPLDYDVFIPNAFSPNGDGINDVFRPVVNMKRAYYISRLQVFDRWGKAVYHSTGAAISWDGNYTNGGPANADTYHYRIGIAFVDGQSKQFTGQLTLFR
jgi:gliding motility-associated-like protein